MANTLIQDLRAVRALKVDRDKKKKAAATADEKFKKKEAQVYARMEAEEAGSFTDKRLGVQFVPTETITAQMQDRSEFIKWARDNDDELLIEKENGELLNALVRTRIDNGEALPPGIGINPRQYISQRAA